MNKTELAILLARERVKAQAELLAQATNYSIELAQVLKGAELYDHALQESLKQIASPLKERKSNGNHCWYCSQAGLHPMLMGDTYHPYKLCMVCGATTTDNELHPYHHKLSLPYRKLAGEVSRLLGDARRAKLPLGIHQLRIPERCN